ncbi:MAG: EAL domain-containing protein [Rhodocyclaceae bacterium]
MLAHAETSKTNRLLWTLLAIVLAVLWSSMLYLHRQGQADALRAAEGDARNLARAFAEHTSASFQRVDFLLHDLRHAWLRTPAEFASAVSRHRALMGDIAFQTAVIAADGHLDFSSLSQNNTRIDLSDREHFRLPRESALRGEDRLFVSRPLKGRVSGKWSIQLARAIIDQNKAFLGVILISVDPEFFAGFYRSIELGPSAAIVMVRDSGEILTRGPVLEGSIGKVLTGTPYLVPGAPLSGVFRRHAQVDGTERIYGFHRLPEMGVSLVVGLSADEVLAPLHRKQLWEYFGTTALSLVLLVLVLAIRRAQIRQTLSRVALAASEKRFRTLFESFTEMVFVTDAQGRLVMAHLPMSNPPANLDDGEWIGKPLTDVFPESAASGLEQLLSQVAEDGIPRELDFVFLTDGTPRHCRAKLSPLKDDTNAAGGLVLVVRDITVERAAAESLRIAATTFESQEGLMITDRRGAILRVNRAFSELTGYAAEEVIGKTPSVLKSGRQGDDFYRGMWKTLIDTGYWQGEVWNRRKSGEVYPEWLTISAVSDDAGQTTHYVGAFSDISERKEAELQIRNLAFYDPLTNLPNRRLLLDRLHQALLSGQRTRTHGAILYLDLDHFKILNDTRGHDAGDALLIEVAQRLCAAVREEDTVSRFGGDEFVVMLENLGASDTHAAARVEGIAEKIRVALTQPFALEGGDYSLSPSIGVSLFLGQNSDVQTLLKQADMALYEAKEGGRNTLRFFNHAMQESVSARALVITGLQQALEREEFVLYLQPQFDARGERLGAEVLLRWQHPQQGLIMPDDFVPYAEESGLIVPIGLWVLNAACDILATWRKTCPQQCLSINVSALQFHQLDFVDAVASALARSGIDGRRLCLELTESALLADVDAAAERMDRLKAMGLMISLDDFGTGYSSLSCLKRLPIDEVKIDRSFVMDIATNAQDATIVQAIIAMCRSLAVTVIAEGVETEIQQDYLRRCGCDAFQGYLLGYPIPLADYPAGTASSG